MAHKYKTVTNVQQPHQAENSCVLRRLPKVSLNHRLPNVLLQCGTVQRKHPNERNDGRRESATSWQSSMR